VASITASASVAANPSVTCKARTTVQGQLQFLQPLRRGPTWAPAPCTQVLRSRCWPLRSPNVSWPTDVHRARVLLELSRRRYSHHTRSSSSRRQRRQAPKSP
jgi:hypothetical protein